MLRYAALMVFAFGAASGMCGDSPSALAQWGDLTGTFVYDGPVPTAKLIGVGDKIRALCTESLVDESLVVGKDGGLANVVIYVRNKDVAVHESYQSSADSDVLMRMEKCRFEPHILTVRLGQNLVAKNVDQIAYHVVVLSDAEPNSSPTLPANGEFTRRFRKAQDIPAPVACSIHPWMKACVVVRDNPYMAVTDSDGKFTLGNVPAGELELQVWHEKVGWLNAKPGWTKGRFKVSIADGKASDLGTIKVSPALLEQR